MAEILTIVVTYNGKKWIERCLRSAQGSAIPTDIMVIDNGSEDGTTEWIREHLPDVILSENRENLGFGAANNIGFRYAVAHGYRFVYLLNQDAWVFPETFGTLLRAFEAADIPGKEERQGSKRLGILSPMQMEANLTRMDAQFRKHCAAALEKDDAETVPVPFVMAAHWMVSAECLEVTGGFSPAFPHYGEDKDFLQRAAFHGFTAAVVKTASAVHDRAERPRPKDYRMRLKVVTAKTAVTDPRHDPNLSAIAQSVILALQGIIHFSTIPWKGIGELRRSFDELKRCRKESQQQGAFL
ncbi:MAG: glycosyltransferase family 2 protein [Bacteroidales bacterium]|nr:glycosyltransferase family 2 protein [Bacteroidales bacterium]